MRVVLAVLVVFALLAPPASAQETTQIADRCGDAFAWVNADGQTTSSPDPFSPSFDIETASIATVRDDGRDDGAVLGIDFSLQLCGDAVEPEWSQHYAWHWTNEDGCDLRLSYERWIHAGGPDVVKVPLTLVFRQTCVSEEQTLPIGTQVENSFDLKLDPSAVTLDGKRLTIALRLADTPAEAQHAIADGTVLVEPFATAQMAWGPTSVFYRDPDYSVTVAGGRDGTGPGADFIVGQ